MEKILEKILEDLTNITQVVQKGHQMTEQERQSVDDIKFKVNRLHTLVFRETDESEEPE
jgi:hypothetical protein